MAVCGRCLLCGYKFDGRHEDGTAPDEAVRWECTSEVCAKHAKRSRDLWGEVYEHAICTQCHDNLMNGTLTAAVADLVALLERRDGR